MDPLTLLAHLPLRPYYEICVVSTADLLLLRDKKFRCILVWFGHHSDDKADKEADRRGDDAEKRRVSGLEAGENRQSQGGEKPRPHAPDGSRFVKPLPVEAQQVAGEQRRADGAP